MWIVGTVASIALLMMIVEAAAPGRSFPRVRGWWARALALNAVQVLVTIAAGRLWDGWMVAHRPFSLDGLGAARGAAVGYLAITFVYYWWHRWRHESPFLWRTFHQVHHSAQRIEILTAFYKHPAEVLVNGILSSAVLSLGLGLGPGAVAGAVTLTGLAELVYHWNVRTPRWLGYLFQRPESHCAHHETGQHSRNYSDLPLWDMLFGTFHNPPTFEGRCGFGDGERRLGDMLRGIDVGAAASSRAS